MRSTLLCLVFTVTAWPALAQSQAAPEPIEASAEPAAVEQPAVSAVAPPSFGSLFTGLAHDFARLPSAANFLTLAGGGVLAQAVHHEDVSLALRAHASQPLDEVFDGGAKTGSGWVQVGGAFGVYALGRAMGHTRVSEVGADLVQAQLLNAVLTQGLKFAVDRTRPDQGRYSFPSGHTSSAFATATVLQRELGWKAGVPAYVLATYVGASRMTENRHFASDVIFGAAIGMVAGRTVTVGHGAARFAVAPVMLPGGAGVMLNRTP